MSSPPAKRGRPANDGVTPKRKSVRRLGAAPKSKEIKCLFAPNFCKWEGKDALHRVFSDGRGQELINIKNSTSNDLVRAALSLLNDDDPGQASALELHYHNNCLRGDHHTCKDTQSMSTEVMVANMCDTEILMYLQSSLSTEPFKIDMSSLNKRYVELCRENGAREASQKQGKYLKNLVQTNLPQISFTKRPDRRKSEVLQHQSKLGETIDLSMTYDFDGLGENENVFRY